MFTSAFPNLKVTVEKILAEGAKVAYLWSATGVHEGELMGIPPTGKTITITGMAVDRFANGKSVEHWEISDQLGMLQQIGAVPAQA
jgi:predicted ester cyclase